MGELMNEVNAQTALLPQWVQYWMNWMGIVFIASIVFVWKHKPARIVLLSLFAPMAIGMGIFALSNSVHLMGVGHIVVWLPLLYYLYQCELSTDGFNIKSLYGVWMVLLIATMVISLFFDFRDVVLILLGHK